MFEEKIAKIVKNAIIETLTDNKDAIKERIHDVLAETDLPIPDTLEKPVDELLEALLSTAIDGLIGFLNDLNAQTPSI